jgi:predicted transposase YdaD
MMRLLRLCEGSEGNARVRQGDEHLGTLIRYLLWTGGEPVHTAVGRVLHSLVDAQRAEEMMRSYGEELIERGRRQGREEGREEGLEEGLEKGLEQGRLRGRAEAVLQLLTARGIPIDEASRQHILSCSEMATLDRWFARSLHASSLSEVLAPLSQ